MLLIRYIIIRFFWLFITLFIFMSLVFFATRIAHINVWFTHMEFPQTFYFVRDEYIAFLRSIITEWDWGEVDQKPVWDSLIENAPNTLRLNLIAFAFYFSVGILIGFLTALKAHTPFDKLMHGIFIVVGSIPSFIWIFLLIILFGYTIPILPPQPPSVEAPLYWRIAGWILPVTALSLAPIAKFGSMMRNELVDNLSADYLLLLRTKGLNRRKIMSRHLLRDSFIPIMPEIAPTFVFVIIGSFFVEQIYNMRGVATLLFTSMFRPGVDAYYITINTPMTVLISLFYATMTLVFLFLVDVMYAVIDPRIRVGQQK